MATVQTTGTWTTARRISSGVIVFEASGGAPPPPTDNAGPLVNNTPLKSLVNGGLVK